MLECGLKPQFPTFHTKEFDMLECEFRRKFFSTKKEELLLFLENINPENFIKSNNERNIDIGE